VWSDPPLQPRTTITLVDGRFVRLVTEFYLPLSGGCEMNWLKLEWPSLLFDDGVRGWVEATLLACMFWTALARPERINSRLKFRLAALFLATAIAAHPLLRVYVFICRPSDSDWKSARKDDVMMVFIIATIPSLLTMLAVLLGIDSVIPRSPRRGGGKGDARDVRTDPGPTADRPRE